MVEEEEMVEEESMIEEEMVEEEPTKTVSYTHLTLPTKRIV